MLKHWLPSFSNALTWEFRLKCDMLVPDFLVSACNRAGKSTRDSGRVDQLTGYKITTRYLNANYRKQKEIHIKWAWVECDSFINDHCILSNCFCMQMHLQFRSLPMHMCAHEIRTDRDWHYLLFSLKCIFSYCGHAQNIMVTGTQVPASNRDSGTRVKNLYPLQP